MKKFVGLAFLVAVGVGGALAFRAFAPPRIPENPLEAVPANAQAVLRVNVPALRNSPIFTHVEALTGLAERMDALEERCGFDPFEMVDALYAFPVATEPDAAEPDAAARPEADGDASSQLTYVGLLLAGHFDHERLGACLGDALESTGQEHGLTTVGGFPALAAGASRAVFVGRQGVILGSEEVAEEVLRTLQGDKPSLRDEAPELAALLERVAQRPGGGSRELALVGTFPGRWRERPPAPVRSALGAVDLGDALGSLEAFAAGGRVSRGLALSLLLHFDDAEAAQAAHDAAAGMKERLMNAPLIAMSPAGAALETVELEARGADATLAFDVDGAGLATLLDAAEFLGR
ncbi:MAG: hypothetical protein AAF447_28200 [Myxococcota bacterium]